MKTKFILALMGGLLAGSVAQAATMGGSYAISTSGTASITETNLLASPFSMPLTTGVPTTVDFIRLTSHEEFGFGSDSLGVNANFTFTQPASGSLADSGSGSIGIFGIFTVGSLHWTDGPGGTNVNFGDGSIINVNLDDVSFVGGLTDSETVHATFTLVKGATVPEPASLAILGAALVAMPIFGRRRRR